MMGKRSGEEICLFVRDEQTGRFLFNAKALQALGINPVEAQQRGYPMKEQSALAEAMGDGEGYLGHANSTERATFSEEAPDQIVSDQEIMPLDAFGYLGGLFEARFYKPHSTTDDPRDEIREAASLYGLELAMMMSIAKVESGFNPGVRTGSYKGLLVPMTI
jgi:soluble lytic murein transglycosylase-like protein